MSQLIVSVIIPTYKRNTTLKRAINSVLNQTIDNLKIIMVDELIQISTIVLNL